MPRKLKTGELLRLTPQEYAEAGKRRMVVVLDNVRSMHNVGSVFRTADALRIEALYLCGITGCPPHAEIHKSALGAEEVVKWYYHKETTDAVAYLKEQGYRVWSLEQTEGSVLLEDMGEHVGDDPLAIVLGNEVDGVQQQVIDLSYGAIEIEQFGTKHSMNVSVAGGKQSVINSKRLCKYVKLLHLLKRSQRSQ